MIKNGISNRFLRLLVIPLLFAFLVGPSYTSRASTQGAPDSLGSAAASAVSAASSAATDNSYLKIIQASPEQVILEFTPPAPQFEASGIAEQPCQVASIPGLAAPTMAAPTMAASDSDGEASGSPSLPVQGAMLGIPQDAQPILQIISAESSSLPGSYIICPTPKPVLSHTPNSPWQLDGYTYEYAPAYQVDAFSPAAPAEIVATGSLRSQRFAELRFNPLQYNPVSGELRHFSRIRVALEFNASGGQADKQTYDISEGYFEDNLRGLLLNYEQARAWRSQPTPTIESEAITAPHGQPTVKILVNQDGFYQVSYADLLAAGVPAATLDGLDPHTFQLFNKSLQVAIYVQGEADSVFNPGDYLLFYGQKANTKYTDTNVYWLAWDVWGAPYGLRMASLNGAPSGSAGVPMEYLTTRHAEMNTDYYSNRPSGSDKDHWYWGKIDASIGPAHLDFTTTLRHLGAGSHTITVRGLLKGYSADPYHHTKIYLNGFLIDDHTFSAEAEYSFSVSLPQSYLVEGTNTFRVECPRDGGITSDVVLVNWFEIDYYDTYFAENDLLLFDGDHAGVYEYRIEGFSSVPVEAFDITNPLAPALITGATVQVNSYGLQMAFETTISGEHHYLAQKTTQRLRPLNIILDTPSSWKSTSVGADYIVITHANFLSQVQSLASYRASQGMRVQVIDVQDLYDEFNYGVFSPEAIKSFLAYAYANWKKPAPGFVLLVGDGTFDFKNFYGYNEQNYIPPYLDEVDPIAGEVPTDNRFVSVSGGDILPDMYIGRFPVRSAAEAQTMVDKTLNYELYPPQGSWNVYQTFIADNADSGGNYAAQSDQIINTYVPSSYVVDKVYYGVNYTDKYAARDAIMATINAGRLIVHYAGNGSTRVWAAERLFEADNIPSLTNGNRLPFMLPMTFGEGYFVWPNPPGIDYSAMGESIVRINGRGAIASWSPAGNGANAGLQLLDASLFGDLFNKNKTQIGYLTTNAKYYLYAHSSSYNDLVETYTLFGDPALRLQMPKPGSVNWTFFSIVRRATP